jgi:hypothetical protein
MRSLAVLLVFALAGAVRADDDFKPLFDGKSLQGWKFVFRPPFDRAEADRAFEVKDGVIQSHGKPLGYMYSADRFENYIIRYEWRFPKEQPPNTTLNTGLLVHIQEPHEVMPKSVEPQGRLMDHGKLFFIKCMPIGAPMFDESAHKAASRPQGEWNVTEVACAPDGSVTVKLNGVKVASGKSMLKSGPIGFQSEGAEFHIRRIEIKQLK